MMHPRDWLSITEAGLYCVPGHFHIDPATEVDAAIITHAHGDHARSGHNRIWGTKETIAIMQLRYGVECAAYFHTLSYRDRTQINEVDVYLLPAGHILGSAQVVIEYGGYRVIISGSRICLGNYGGNSRFSNI